MKLCLVMRSIGYFIYETFNLKNNLNFILTMPFASPFGKYGDGKYVGIPRAEWFKRPEIKSILRLDLLVDITFKNTYVQYD